jgi:aminoglycoside phosphotransferase (APT) family kinase protein
MMADSFGPLPAERIVRAFDLGLVREPPTYAARGELGHVWRMCTERGCWAVKRLTGPVEESTGEDVEFQLAVLASGIPLPRPVLTRDGAAVAVEPDGTGYRVYEWVELDSEGRVDPSTAGQLLARIHAVAWPAEAVHPWFYKPVPDDRWPELIVAARAAQAPWLELLECHVAEILATTATLDGVPPGLPIRCHLDFNTENVLIDRNGEPWVIDWENSGGGDPAQELAQTIFEFAADDTDAGTTVLAGYRAEGGSVEVRDMGAFSMSFAVQANLVELYARRALGGPKADRSRAVWRLESMLPKLLTIQRAERILTICNG